MELQYPHPYTTSRHYNVPAEVVLIRTATGSTIQRRASSSRHMVLSLRYAFYSPLVRKRACARARVWKSGRQRGGAAIIIAIIVVAVL